MTMVKTREKQKNSTKKACDHAGHSDAEQVLRIWEQDMPEETQKSIDTILDFMIESNISPKIQITGDLVSAMTDLSNNFQSLFPLHLQPQTKDVLDHLILWVCDYAEETGLKALNMSLEFRERQTSTS